MPYSEPFQGFRLAFDRHGSGQSVVLLHGWPGDRTDYDELVPLLADEAEVIVPDLRGFGESDKHLADAEEFYSGTAQASAVIALMEQLGISGAVVAGYDIGSFIAQCAARMRPDLVRALVVSPPLPGAGRRVLDLEAVKEFWYTSFHQLQLADDLVDGDPAAVRAYLQHFWNHWSGPGYVIAKSRLDHLTRMYSPPGSFTASIMWYRSSGNPLIAYAHEQTPAADDRLSTPTRVLWQENDPIFPLAWGDRLGDFFTAHRFDRLAGVGHFTPLEATDTFAVAIRDFLTH
ncbi:alpha/beta hydrolase [Planotetraspora phitsanulokensis]|uniref:Hydrolase n=1 Tax=Planotetraspora phitsanulokensis TaxID=575192 RepID=A0A8J3UH43_9ACTN|nr:alpha/beta hydrolase [Planotetraspora phitsanulokensis]GII43186.1 hydrolase [Planotetraspora phitsanulokensis]